MAEEDELYDFLRNRGVPENTINRMTEQKVILTCILNMFIILNAVTAYIQFDMNNYFSNYIGN